MVTDMETRTRPGNTGTTGASGDQDSLSGPKWQEVRPLRSPIKSDEQQCIVPSQPSWELQPAGHGQRMGLGRLVGKGVAVTVFMLIIISTLYPFVPYLYGIVRIFAG